MEGSNEAHENVVANPNPDTTNPRNSNLPPPQTLGTLKKTDPAWQYVSVKKEGKINVFTCLLCASSYRGGGINRLKQHLAGVSGQVSSCKKVSHDVRAKMKESLLEGSKKKHVVEEDNEVREVEEPLASLKRKAPIVGKIDSHFASRTTPGSQPSIKSAWASQEAQYNAKMAFAHWAYVNCVPFNAMTCPLFQKAVDAAAAIGPGFKVPSFHEYRVTMLRDCKKELQLLIDSHRAKWKENGCTLMADGWTDVRQRTLINFLVYSLHGMVFVKSVDASDIVKDANTLFSLFTEVIEWVGPQNLVHVVTDNAANYVACGRLIKKIQNYLLVTVCSSLFESYFERHCSHASCVRTCEECI